MDHLTACRILPRFPSLVERYFTPSTYVPPVESGSGGGIPGPQCILKHSNRVSLVCLDVTHPILSANKTVVKVDFELSSMVGKEANQKMPNRLGNQVKGKYKKGGQTLSPESLLCQVHCNDETVYNIYAAISGRLIEVNKRLIKEPNILRDKPFSDGFLAIILPEHRRGLENTANSRAV